MNQKGHTNDEFCTPQYIFKQLDDIFKFQVDVACNSNNRLCDIGFMQDLDIDALKAPWNSYRCFCNPPFSKKGDFIKKAHDEVLYHNCPIVVMILPLNSMDTKVWHEYIESKFHYEILRGRISFIDPETKQPRKGNNSGTVIVYFKKRIEV